MKNPLRSIFSPPRDFLLAVPVLTGLALGGPVLAQDGIETLHVQGNVYMIAGDGANIAVQIGDEGIIVVDSGAGEQSDAVIAEIREISKAPIYYLINTSTHPNNVGGNLGIAGAGVDLTGGGFFAAEDRPSSAIVGQENVLLHMAIGGVPQEAWPSQTFIEYKNIYLNGESVRVLHQPFAHSDSDSIVFFRGSDVVVTGQIFNTHRFPIIDLEKGGSIQGVIDALNELLTMVLPPIPMPWQPGGTKVVPAEGPISEQAELVEYRDMLTIVRDVIQTMIDNGMSLEEVLRANPTAGFTSLYGSDSGPWTTDMFVEAVYLSLTRQQ